MSAPRGSDRPDRPVGPVARAGRFAVRRLRMARLHVRLRGKLRVGDNVYIGRRAAVLAPNRVELGDNVAIGADFHVESDLVAGSDILISSRVAIVGRDHAFDDPERSVYWEGRTPSGEVRLEGDNLIGFGTIIIAPVTIGRGAIVGAGSVVTRDLPPDTICVGAPARPIRARFDEKPDSLVRRVSA